MRNNLLCRLAFRLVAVAAIFAIPLVAGGSASAGTLVTFNFSVGGVQKNVQVDMFENVAPQTVANFLNYVNNNRYDATVVHRLATNFVIQGGGYKASEFTANPLPNAPAHIPTFTSPQNEYRLTNGRVGTIAMARIGGQVNSATSEWFFNLNSTNSQLDTVDQGFTVFGWVVGDGMNVINEIKNLTPTNVPFPNYVGVPPQFNPFATVPKDAQGNFVILNDVTAAAPHAAFQNPINNLDTNNDNIVTASDALIVINTLLEAGGGHQASLTQITNTYEYFDPSGDGRVNSIDAMLVINHLLAQQAAASQSATPMAITAVPEPSTAVLAATAVLALTGAAWRRRARRSR